MAVPFLISILVVQANVFADTFWISNLGERAVSGMTSSVPMYMVISSVGIGISAGVVTTVAYRIGKGDLSIAGKLAGNAITLSVIIAIVCSVVILLSEDILISVMGAEDVSTEIHDYLLPLLLLSPITVLNNVFGGMLRAEGAATRSTIVQMSSVGLNIVLDPLLIFGLGMGIMGAGLATVLSYAFGICISSLWYIRRKTMIEVHRKDLIISKEVSRELMNVGGARMVEGFVNNAVILFQRVFIIMASGTAGVMLFNVPFRYVTLSMCPVEALGMSATPVIAANYGRSDKEKMRDASRYVIKLSLALALVLMVVLFLLSPFLIELFTLEESMLEWRDELVWNLGAYSVILPLFALQTISSSILLSIKKSKVPMRVTMIVGVFRMVVFWLAVPFGFRGITVALIFSYVLSCTLMFLLMRKYFTDACARSGQ